MIKIEPKPYKIEGKIQNYDWGTKNDKAFIPKYLNIDTIENIPYAELWIGVHPNAPSQINVDENKLSLASLIEKFPTEILGERVYHKFKTLPFLLKILSIEKALSIQAHPDKNLAKILHEKDPKNYPDENHKPEIAIAIDHLKALVGLKDPKGIKQTFLDYPELKILLTTELINIIEGKNIDEDFVKEIYSQIMNSEYEKLSKGITEILKRLKNKSELNESEQQFLKQHNNYGIDVGLISILLFNIINLAEGEAIFTVAGIPHAYIEGNIIECMANSDNVVRAGLTPKYKDIDTLTKMLVVNSENSDVEVIEESDRKIYKTNAEEFEIEEIILSNTFIEKNNEEINIILVLSGNILIEFGNKNTISYSQGDFILIPAVLKQYKISKNESAKIYRVRVPK
ncbi:MAG: mannose-6-phosphate isomerase, class I [Ignavibacteriales bacterium]|nr:mannose-6-phosphate isomerase, class I [Ignavibacteriales bacterium]MCB9219506.1 mannose-6-phosphate isomerase, class I [Ignavibacteriales bacterium]